MAQEETLPRSVTGEPLSPEGTRMLHYLSSRAAAITPADLRSRVRAAMAELDTALAGVNDIGARQHPFSGEWGVADVVDHVAQTQIRAADELRHLLAGRRPPAPPVYEALVSGAAAWAPWDELLDGLRSANEEFDAILATPVHAGTPSSGVTARTILVANRTGHDGRVTQEIFAGELDWKEYTLLQRLHLLDHRTQVRKLRAALTA